MRWTPGFVVSYDAPTRTARVNFPGAEGAEEFPVATFCYPIGDKSEHTDIRVLPGDRVWLDFIGDDPRHPIILGFRPKETDNAIDVRRLHHKRIELVADTDMLLQGTSGNMLIKAGSTITLQAPNIVLDGATRVTGHLTYQSGITGTGSATSNGKDVSDAHAHKLVKAGTDTSGTVV